MIKQQNLTPITNLLLIPIFLLTLISGVKLHLFNNHLEVYSLLWTTIHLSSSLMFIILIATHIKLHKFWYRNLFNDKVKSNVKRKYRITLILAFLLIGVLLTGVMIWFNGNNSDSGLWHYKLGLIMSALALLHFIKRAQSLSKNLQILKPSPNS